MLKVRLLFGLAATTLITATVVALPSAPLFIVGILIFQWACNAETKV